MSVCNSIAERSPIERRCRGEVRVERQRRAGARRLRGGMVKECNGRMLRWVRVTCRKVLFYCGAADLRMIVRNGSVSLTCDDLFVKTQVARDMRSNGEDQKFS